MNDPEAVLDLLGALWRNVQAGTAQIKQLAEQLDSERAGRTADHGAPQNGDRVDVVADRGDS